jgi:hypothetical protein
MTTTSARALVVLAFAVVFLVLLAELQQTDAAPTAAVAATTDGSNFIYLILFNLKIINNFFKFILIKF